MLYPNQRFRPQAPGQAKHLNDQVLADQRQAKAREQARRLRRVVDDARRRVKAMIKELEHTLQHGAHDDHRIHEGIENLEEVAKGIEHLAGETHTEIAHNPASHMPEYQQGELGGEASLFQLIGVFIVILRRIHILRSHERARKAKDKAAEAKRLLNAVKAEAKRR